MFYIKVKPCHKTYKRYDEKGMHTFFCSRREYEDNLEEYCDYFKVNDDFTLLNKDEESFTCFGRNWEMDKAGKYISGFGVSYYGEQFYDCYKVCEISRKPIRSYTQSKIKTFKEIRKEQLYLQMRIDALFNRMGED